MEIQERNLELETVEVKMNQVLQRLGLNFNVRWIPDPTRRNHGNIDLAQRIINIHDTDESDAWSTLLHECLELKLRPLLALYRNLINVLIEIVEKEAYRRKEQFLEVLPIILKEIEKMS